MFTKLLLLSLFTSTVSVEMTAVYEAESKSIIISGLDPNSYNVSVYTGDVQDFEQLPKLIGQLDRLDEEMRFSAKYGFSRGMSYTVIASSIDAPKENLGFRAVVTIPEKVFAPSTYLKEVYPTASLLPMNQLKFYFEFSAPMRIGQAFDHIKLYRMPEEKEEKEAFLVMPEELWDEPRKRLTIFFDPGRIKRGVAPNLQSGLPLEEGRRYKLVVNKDWLDKNGVELLHGFEKEFEVGTVDRTVPNPEAWTINSPQQGTNQVLSIDFHESMDYGLLHGTIKVMDEDLNEIQGAISITEQERQWHFRPHGPWQEGNYNISINPWLEDLAGNNLNRKFDVDLNDPADVPNTRNEILVPLQIQITKHYDKN